MKTFYGLQYQIDGRFSFDTKTFKPIAQNSPQLSDAFEQEIHKLLTTIDEDKPVGQRILKSISPWMRSIVIAPGTSIVARPLSGADALPQGFTHNNLTGTGKGTEGLVFINPSHLGMAAGPAAQKDAILLHEIIHAVRATHGLFQQKPMALYDDLEEFYAVMLANIYISSKYPGKPLRGDHRMTPLHKPGYSDKVIGMLSNPGLEENKLYYFCQHHREELLKLTEEMESLTFALRDAKCRFNPLRVCYYGYNPDVEEAHLPPAGRRKQGYGPFVAETFAEAAARLLKDAPHNPDMWSSSISDRLGGLM
jgi:hypothetical protein